MSSKLNPADYASHSLGIADVRQHPHGFMVQSVYGKRKILGLSRTTHYKIAHSLKTSFTASLDNKTSCCKTTHFFSIIIIYTLLQTTIIQEKSTKIT